MSKNFSGKFYLFYRIYDTEILSTKMSVRLFGVDSSIILFNRFLNMLKESFGKKYFPGRLSMIKNTLPVTGGAVEIGSA